MARVRSLGYVVVETTDLDKWVDFATLLGLQISEQSEDHLLLRMDHKAYRFRIEKGQTDRLTTYGWEVGGAADLEELSGRLTAAGYAVKQLSRDEARARQVTGLATFDDPDGTVAIELFHGLQESLQPFVSPLGARFVTGSGGLGHAFQLVEDWEAYRALYFDILGFHLSDHIDADPEGTVELTFLHCNPRHHSFAFAQIPGAPTAVGHIMLEVDDLDPVGRAYDEVLAGAAPLISTLGKHTNDKMVSFYVKSPSVFGIEYGTGGLTVDCDTWTPTRYNAAHYWGHERQRPVDVNDPADHG